MRGFALTELVVVIAIITILLAIGGVQYHQWQVKYAIESQIRQMYSDLMGARTEAMQQNQLYIVRLESSSGYTVYRDENGNNVYDQGDTKIEKFSRSGLKYPIKWNGGNVLEFTMNQRGLISQALSVRVTKKDGSLSKAEYDCLNISRTRINLGKYNGNNNRCENR